MANRVEIPAKDLMVIARFRNAVASVIISLSEAWRHDVDAYGAQFTEDATYVTFVGTYYRGRREIVESHRALFAKFLKGTQLADEILDVRFCGPNIAVITSRGDTYKRTRPKPRKLTKVQTYTLVREDDGKCVWPRSKTPSGSRSWSQFRSFCLPQPSRSDGTC